MLTYVMESFNNLCYLCMFPLECLRISLKRKVRISIQALNKYKVQKLSCFQVPPLVYHLARKGVFMETKDLLENI